VGGERRTKEVHVGRVPVQEKFLVRKRGVVVEGGGREGRGGGGYSLALKKRATMIAMVATSPTWEEHWCVAVVAVVAVAAAAAAKRAHPLQPRVMDNPISRGQV
jgi:hypothetical protein